MEERETTALSYARRFARFQKTDLFRGGVCCRTRLWLKLKIVCAFCSIFDVIRIRGDCNTADFFARSPPWRRARVNATSATSKIKRQSMFTGRIWSVRCWRWCLFRCPSSAADNLVLVIRLVLGMVGPPNVCPLHFRLGFRARAARTFTLCSSATCPP